MVGRLAQADVEARRENLKRIEEQIVQEEMAAGKAALDAHARKSKQVSQELAAKRCSQGDIITRLTQVKVALPPSAQACPYQGVTPAASVPPSPRPAGRQKGAPLSDPLHSWLALCTHGAT